MIGHITLIIAHNHYLFRTILQNIVQSYAGFCVLAHVDTAAGLLEKTKELAPDVIIADIALTDMEESKALQMLSANCARSRVIISWSYDDEHRVMQAIAEPCAGYIVHDAAPAEYVFAIKQAMKGEVFYCTQTQKLAGRQNIEPAPAAPSEKLNEKQLMILYCIWLGFISKEIAIATSLTENTINTYRKKFKAISGSRSIAALERFMRKYGMKW